MASFALVTLQPPGYPHVAAFTEIQLLLFYSLCDLGHNVVLATNRFPEGATPIVFGAHLISADFHVELPPSALIFNTEQLMEEGSVWSKRIFALSLQHRIWDYASANLERLRALNPGALVHRLRLGYHRELERVPYPRTDSEPFLFYGSVSPMREEILARIQLSDKLQVQAFSGVYGWQRDGLLARCRAVLNLHAHTARLLEWPRILHLVANAVPCIALLHPLTVAEDDQLSYVLSVDEASPTVDLQRWFQVPEQLRAHAEVSRERFRDQEDQHLFTAELLDQSFSSGFEPASGPIHSPGWVTCSAQRDPDPLWYQHTYKCWSADPRSIADFHQQEGHFRQYHPDPLFFQSFRPPLILPQVSGGPDWPLRCAVVLHIHTQEKALLFFNSFGRYLVDRADFYATTSCEIAASTLRSVASDYGSSIEVCIVPNRGRDIPSKYLVFNQVLSGYDLCFFSHGKQSDLQWFYDHNSILAGSLQRVDAILKLFSERPNLGLVFPDYLSCMRPQIGWGNMRRVVDDLLAQFSLDTRNIDLLEFPAGGFFWARPLALGLLHGLNLTFDQLPQEPLDQDHTILHALERMPCLSCEFLGFQWEKISREDAVGFTEASAVQTPMHSLDVELSNTDLAEEPALMQVKTFHSLDVNFGLGEDAPIPDLGPLEDSFSIASGPFRLLHLHHYDRTGYLPLLWRDFLATLRTANYLVFVSTCSGFDREAQSFLSHQGIVALRRPNRGRCIGAYRDTALACSQWIASGVPIERLILMNDSVLPLGSGRQSLASLEALMDLVEDGDPMMAGFTDSYELGCHLQSYGLVANRDLLADMAWLLFWSALDTDLPKHELVQAGEIGLSIALRSVGVQLRVLFPLLGRLMLHPGYREEIVPYENFTVDRINSSLFLANVLRREGFGFVKKLAMFALPTGKDLIRSCLEDCGPVDRPRLIEDLDRLLMARVMPEENT